MDTDIIESKMDALRQVVKAYRDSMSGPKFVNATKLSYQAIDRFTKATGTGSINLYTLAAIYAPVDIDIMQSVLDVIAVGSTPPSAEFQAFLAHRNTRLFIDEKKMLHDELDILTRMDRLGCFAGKTPDEIMNVWWNLVDDAKRMKSSKKSSNPIK